MTGRYTITLIILNDCNIIHVLCTEQTEKSKHMINNYTNPTHFQSKLTSYERAYCTIYDKHAVVFIHGREFTVKSVMTSPDDVIQLFTNRSQLSTMCCVISRALRAMSRS